MSDDSFNDLPASEPEIDPHVTQLLGMCISLVDPGQNIPLAAGKAWRGEFPIGPRPQDLVEIVIRRAVDPTQIAVPPKLVVVEGGQERVHETTEVLA